MSSLAYLGFGGSRDQCQLNWGQPIRHPDQPGRFILGVECDGATYHSAKATRDRDRLRQTVLERLGWRIHRVWSTDWFRAPHADFETLLGRIDSLRV